MEQQRNAWIGSQHTQDMSRLQTSRRKLRFIAPVHRVDKLTIPRSLCVEMIAESPVDKRFNDIRERNEKLKVKILDQQRQDILRSDTLKPVVRTVVIYVHLFVPLEFPIETVRRRHPPPEFPYDIQRFRPAQMSVPAHHV